jgi:hypothetical protein
VFSQGSQINTTRNGHYSRRRSEAGGERYWGLGCGLGLEPDLVDNLKRKGQTRPYEWKLQQCTYPGHNFFLVLNQLLESRIMSKDLSLV